MGLSGLTVLEWGHGTLVSPRVVGFLQAAPSNRAKRAAEPGRRSTASLTLGLPCLGLKGSDMNVRSSGPDTNYIW